MAFIGLSDLWRGFLLSNPCSRIHSIGGDYIFLSFDSPSVSRTSWRERGTPHATEDAGDPKGPEGSPKHTSEDGAGRPRGTTLHHVCRYTTLSVALSLLFRPQPMKFAGSLPPKLHWPDQGRQPGTIPVSHPSLPVLAAVRSPSRPAPSLLPRSVDAPAFASRRWG